MQGAQPAVRVDTRRVIVEMAWLAAKAVLAGVAVSAASVLFVVWLASVAR